MVDQEIKRTTQAHEAFGAMLQNDPAFARAVAAGDKEALRKAAQPIMDSPLAQFVTICDTKGTVLLRAHNSKAGDTLPPSRVSMRVPLSEGRMVSGIEPGTQIKLTLGSGVPIRHEGAITGVVIIGMDLGSSAFVDRIKNLIKAECTILLDDTRVSTTIMNQGKRVIDTRLNNKTIYEKVIGKGEKVLTRNTIFGEEYDTIYWPWKDLNGKNAGMIFAGLPRADIEHAQFLVILMFVIVGLVMGSLMLVISIFMARAIVRPLRLATAFAEDVARGNLDGTLVVKTRDEVGVLSRALGVMVETLKTKMRESEGKSREAEEHARKALAAMEEAGKAKETAEAGQTALLQAAGHVEQVVGRLTAAVEHINEQVESSTKSVSFQHERVTDSATAMEEMNSTVLEVAKNASSAAESSERATQRAQEGEGIVKESIDSISHVQRDTEHLKEAMNRLGVQAESIGAVMTVINDIADQTNLLALNAAIEAARAGEAGRGFAVVADEVRKLAEKTMAATKEVGSAIAGIQAGAKDSIEAVDRTGKNLGATTELVSRSGESLHGIVSESASIADQVRGIAAASEEQTAASEGITRSLGEINVSSSETAEAMRASTEATKDLAAQVRELQALVQRIRK
jgi:methyl-accepting chemotaxis protein